MAASALIMARRFGSSSTRIIGRRLLVRAGESGDREMQLLTRIWKHLACLRLR